MEFVILTLFFLFIFHFLLDGILVPLQRYNLIDEYVILRGKLLDLKSIHTDSVNNSIYTEFDSYICKTASRLEKLNYLTVRYRASAASDEEKVKLNNFIESINNCNVKEVKQLFDSYLTLNKRVFDINMQPLYLYLFPWFIYKTIIQWKKSNASKSSADRIQFDQKYFEVLKKAMLLFAGEKHQHTIALY